MSRPVAAGVLTILGGLFVLAAGSIFAIIGAILESTFGFFAKLLFVGLVVGLLLVLDGILMIALPSGRVVWGVLAVVLGVVSIPFALGGFIVGFILTVIGGVLAIFWRPPTIVASVRVIPPSSGS